MQLTGRREPEALEGGPPGPPMKGGVLEKLPGRFWFWAVDGNVEMRSRFPRAPSEGLPTDDRDRWLGRPRGDQFDELFPAGGNIFDLLTLGLRAASGASVG